jgi:hypothetical protein
MRLYTVKFYQLLKLFFCVLAYALASLKTTFFFLHRATFVLHFGFNFESARQLITTSNTFKKTKNISK